MALKRDRSVVLQQGIVTFFEPPRSYAMSLALSLINDDIEQSLTEVVGSMCTVVLKNLDSTVSTVSTSLLYRPGNKNSLQFQVKALRVLDISTSRPERGLYQSDPFQLYVDFNFPLTIRGSLSVVTLLITETPLNIYRLVDMIKAISSLNHQGPLPDRRHLGEGVHHTNALLFRRPFNICPVAHIAPLLTLHQSVTTL
ncbi:jg4931 [Pararge aegeria aegeria]|uniref:Jg4931 protein n=1 Tax=Pararge aegeria aegeria TaxID=348720 RepID=A0A8S4SMA7_9NEOP|nr:jg4931 [Pararge aegeria aegeria]